MTTAGRTVLFSSLAIACAMAALLVFPQRFLYSMGIGGHPRWPGRRCGRAARPPSDPGAARRPGQRARAGAGCSGSPPSRRGPKPQGGWYRLSRLVMRRAGADRARLRGAADRARDPLPLRPLHPGRHDRAAGGRREPRGARGARLALSPQPDPAAVRSPRPRFQGRGGSASRRGSAALSGVARVDPPRRRRQRGADRASRRARRRGTTRIGATGARDPRPRLAGRAAARRPGRRATSTSARASPRTCRSRWPCWS